MEEKVEIPKTGVTFSYMRFLSDSAAGYTIILLFLLAYTNDYPILGMNLKAFTTGVGISQEIAVFILLLFFFLSTPLGLIMNALSWFLLGWLQAWGHACMVKWNIFIKQTKESHLFDNWKDAFGMDKAHWYGNSELMLETLYVYYPHIIERYNHIEGMKIFSRNITLLSLFCMINSGINIVICSNFDLGAFLKSALVLAYSFSF